MDGFLQIILLAKILNRAPEYGRRGSCITGLVSGAMWWWVSMLMMRGWGWWMGRTMTKEWWITSRIAIVWSWRWHWERKRIGHRRLGVWIWEHVVMRSRRSNRQMRSRRRYGSRWAHYWSLQNFHAFLCFEVIWGQRRTHKRGLPFQLHENK